MSGGVVEGCLQGVVEGTVLPSLGGVESDLLLPLFIQDTFTETNNTALASHTPDQDGSGLGWTVDNGTWEAYALDVAGPTGAQPTGVRWLATMEGGLNSGSLTVSVLAITSGGRTAYLTFRGVNATNFCNFGITFDGRVRLFEVNNEVSNQLGEVTGLTTNTQTWYQLRVDWTPTNIQCYLDGVRVFNIDNTTHAAGTRVGLRATHNSFNYDDFVYRREVPILEPARMLYQDGGGWLPFRLTAAARVAAGLVAPVGNQGDTVSYVIRDFGGGLVSSQGRQFYAGLDSLAANQPNVENDGAAVTLQPGLYRLQSLIDSGDPVAHCIRRADPRTDRIYHYGDTFHSGPYVVRDADNVPIYTGCEMGVGYRRFVRKQGEAAVSTFSGFVSEEADKWHNATTLVRAGSRWCQFAATHNGQMQGITSPTLAGLGTAPRVDVGTASAAYINTCVDNTNGIFNQFRSGPNTELVMEFFPDPTDLSTSIQDYLITGYRIYPIEMTAAEADDGSRLVISQSQHRFNATPRRPGMVGIFAPDDGFFGTWYSARGIQVGGASLGTPGAGRWDTDTIWADNTHDANGLTIVPSSAGDIRYSGGPMAVRIDEWNAVTKNAHVGMVWFHQEADEVHGKDPAQVNLSILNGTSLITADADPFGLDDQNGYRGPTCCWWDGDDLICCIADRDGRDREYHYSTDKTNLYYDMMGHILRVYRVSDPLSAGNGTVLKSRISQINQFTYAQLGGGLDTKAMPIGIAHIKRFGESGNVAYMQVGANGLDVTQEQATIALVDVVTGEIIL